MSCGIGHRHGLDPELLWLWHRPIRPQAWEPPCAMGAALENTKKVKNKIKQNKYQRVAVITVMVISNIDYGEQEEWC